MGINHSDGRTGRFPPVVPKTGMHSISNHSCTGIKRLVHKSIIFCPEIVTSEPVLKPPTIWQSNYSTFVKQQLKGLIFKEKHSRGDFQTSGTPNRISQPYYCKETFVQSVCVFGPLNAAGGGGGVSSRPPSAATLSPLGGRNTLYAARRTARCNEKWSSNEGQVVWVSVCVTNPRNAAQIASHTYKERTGHCEFIGISWFWWTPMTG